MQLLAWIWLALQEINFAKLSAITRVLLGIQTSDFLLKRDGGFSFEMIFLEKPIPE